MIVKTGQKIKLNKKASSNHSCDNSNAIKNIDGIINQDTNGAMVMVRLMCCGEIKYISENCIEVY